jgi:hypothetical protein
VSKAAPPITDAANSALQDGAIKRATAVAATMPSVHGAIVSGSNTNKK